MAGEIDEITRLGQHAATAPQHFNADIRHTTAPGRRSTSSTSRSTRELAVCMDRAAGDRPAGCGRADGYGIEVLRRGAAVLSETRDLTISPAITDGRSPAGYDWA